MKVMLFRALPRCLARWSVRHRREQMFSNLARGGAREFVHERDVARCFIASDVGAAWQIYGGSATSTIGSGTPGTRWKARLSFSTTGNTGCFTQVEIGKHRDSASAARFRTPSPALYLDSQSKEKACVIQTIAGDLIGPDQNTFFLEPDGKM